MLWSIPHIIYPSIYQHIKASSSLPLILLYFSPHTTHSTHSRTSVLQLPFGSHLFSSITPTYQMGSAHETQTRKTTTEGRIHENIREGYIPTSVLVPDPPLLPPPLLLPLSPSPFRIDGNNANGCQFSDAAVLDVPPGWRAPLSLFWDWHIMMMRNTEIQFDIERWLSGNRVFDFLMRNMISTKESRLSPLYTRPGNLSWSNPRTTYNAMFPGKGASYQADIKTL